MNVKRCKLRTTEAHRFLSNKVRDLVLHLRMLIHLQDGEAITIREEGILELVREHDRRDVI